MENTHPKKKLPFNYKVQVKPFILGTKKMFGESTGYHGNLRGPWPASPEKWEALRPRSKGEENHPWKNSEIPNGERFT